jgi:RNA methyltransferase, TrmH family
VLTSAKNPKVQAALRLHKRVFREEDRRFLVEGAQAVREALGSPGVLVRLFATDLLHPLAVRARHEDVDVVEVSEDVMRRLTGTVSPQGLVGVGGFLDAPSIDALDGSGCVALLHEVRDPGNAGTVLRSADAAGAAGVIFGATSVDLYNAKTVRASAGSLFHLPVVRGVPTQDAIGMLRETGRRVIAMAADGDTDLYRADLGGRVAFLFGNEARGLPDPLTEAADLRVRIPQAGRADSLNLAAAAAVTLFEWARRVAHQEEALDSIVAAAAHDIRSPLTAMKGFGYALERRWEDMTHEQRTLMLQGIVHDADRMDTILRLLVDAARIVGGTLEVFREQVDVPDLVRTVSEALARDPDHPDVVWVGTAGEVFADPARLRTTIVAFIESLVWWAREGEVSVDATTTASRLHLWVTRGGTELSEEAARALFTPRRPGEGAGSKIGLFVSRGVAEAQGGRAWAEVHDGRLAFHLDLPIDVPST